MLLERDTELGVLGDLVAHLDSSGGRVVLIRGEAGIGKSALVGEFIETHRDEAHVHLGFCDDLLVPRPLDPFWDMARDETSLKEPLTDGDRPAVLEAVLDLLSRSLRPTVMVIEDTHWADEATLDAIKYVGRRAGRTNGLLILTYRDGEVDYDHPLRGVIGDLPPQNVARIQLGGLSLSSVSSIIGASSLDPNTVLEATHGNPFLVTEMASADSDMVSASLQDSVMARVQKLSPAAREMLKTISVIPEPIPGLDVLGLTGATEDRLDECVRRGLLDTEGGFVGFRHDLIRRTIETTLSGRERVAANQLVLDCLPAETYDTHPCLIIHCAVEANDIDRVVNLAPRSARYAVSMGSHRLAVDDFRQLTPHLDLLAFDDKGPILEDWAREEFLVDNTTEAIELNELALLHYREDGNVSAESRILAQAAHFYENAGQRGQAEELARQAVDVLGSDPDGSDLARALEVSAYLNTMAGNVALVPELVDRTLAAGGPDIDERILIRSLNHRGIVANIANYPEGRASLDEAWKRAKAAEQWYEESRALFNHAWAAVEFRDLPIASDYIQRSIASAVRHELPALEVYAEVMHSRILELEGKWARAEDIARDLSGSWAVSQMIALPILGVLEARTGRDAARATLTRAWEMALVADENQRLAPAAAALAEHAWIAGDGDVPVSEFEKVMNEELGRGFRYSPGAIAFWLWKLGQLTEAPEGIAEPYRLVIEGYPREAAAIWEKKGIPYEQGIALMHGDEKARLEALEIFETLGATAVAGKLRQSLRDQGVSIPRGKSRDTRRHAAGLTARQAEVLQLLNEDLSNIEIADRLFVSPRTVEHHVSAVLMKLDSFTREQAVSRARDEGLLTTTR